MKTTVRLPSSSSTRRAASTASRRSATPEVTAASDLKTALDWRATSNAIVVLPVPGGPHRIIEWSLPAAAISLSRRPFRPKKAFVCVGFAPCHLLERITLGEGGLKWLAPPRRGWHLRCGPARFYLLGGLDRSRHPIMIVGIDIGGSTTDAVILDNGGVHVVTIEANDPVAAAAGALGKLVESY